MFLKWIYLENSPLETESQIMALDTHCVVLDEAPHYHLYCNAMHLLNQAPQRWLMLSYRGVSQAKQVKKIDHTVRSLETKSNIA